MVGYIIIIYLLFIIRKVINFMIY